MVDKGDIFYLNKEKTKAGPSRKEYKATAVST
jgi:hypothetical protein